MAEIITKDSEEFKELTGWMKKIGKSVEAATARIRPTIADEHYLRGEDVCEMLHISKRTLCNLQIFLCLFLEKLNMPQNTPVTKAS